MAPGEGGGRLASKATLDLRPEDTGHGEDGSGAASAGPAGMCLACLRKSRAGPAGVDQGVEWENIRRWCQSCLLRPPGHGQAFDLPPWLRRPRGRWGNRRWRGPRAEEGEQNPEAGSGWELGAQAGEVDRQTDKLSEAGPEQVGRGEDWKARAGEQV